MRGYGRSTVVKNIIYGKEFVFDRTNLPLYFVRLEIYIEENGLKVISGRNGTGVVRETVLVGSISSSGAAICGNGDILGHGVLNITWATYVRVVSTSPRIKKAVSNGNGKA